MANSPSADIISTWILTDDKESASTFPQAGRRSSADAEVHAMYWRCVAVFFAVARRTAGAAAPLRLYTGSAASLEKADPFVRELLRGLGVAIHIVPLTYLPPVGYYGRFRNQFYIFDILTAIAAEGTEDNHLVLDSDCLCLRPLDGMFREVEAKGALTLSEGSGPDRLINGITRREMQGIFAEMSGEAKPGVPAYYGGEFYASTSAFIRRLVPLAQEAWAQSIERFRQGKPKLNEEAHLLSYLYDRLGVEGATADPYIRRIWTGVHFRNGNPQDVALPIVHVPAEKRYGLTNVYKLLQNKTSWFFQDPPDERWVRRIQKMVGVPRPTLRKMAGEIASLTYEKISRRS